VGKRVVVVDNDRDALDLVVLDLGLEGHDIVGTALDGDAALELVAELAPDVLVVDHRMPPGPWGIDVAEEVRRRYPGTEVVLYSNHQSSELIRRAGEVGACFVPKGNLRTLRRAVTGV
jgi:DNA-binding NarL/FixJ family response regulator